LTFQDAIHIKQFEFIGKVGARGVAYYMSTTICAVILGIILVTTIQPGSGAEPVTDTSTAPKRNITTQDTLMDLVRNLFPPNIIQACTMQMKTELVYPGSDEIPKNDWPFKTTMASNTNILGLVVFSLAFGIAIASVGKEAEPILKFFASFVAIMMKITGWIINLAPVGVCFLVAGQILEMDDVAKTFASLGWYFATVVLGLTIHGCIILPLIYGIYEFSERSRIWLRFYGEGHEIIIRTTLF
jgi:Na+/H+-dicarboxylate symporter